jgi:hypothetical protein
MIIIIPTSASSGFDVAVPGRRRGLMAAAPPTPSGPNALAAASSAIRDANAAKLNLGFGMQENDAAK